MPDPYPAAEVWRRVRSRFRAVEGRAVQSRRDQLQAYRFVNRRALAALVAGEPDVIDPPMRRLTVTTISGIMIAILIACGFAVFGLIRPTPGDKWKDPGAIITENETGARYVYLNDVLHPVLNYASAVLIAGGTGKAKVIKVDRSDLMKVRRGATIGIDGIPDSLPAAKNLASSTWTVCSRLQAGQSDELDAHVSVSVGSDAGAQPLPDGRAVVVGSVTGDASYLLWQGQRLAVGSSSVATSLGVQNATKLEVGTAFLNAVTPGPALRAPDVPHARDAWTTEVSSRVPIVGQLLHTTDNDRYFLVLADGVAQVDPVETALLRTLPIGPNHSLLAPISTSESVALNLPTSPVDWKTVEAQFNGLPATVPPLVDTAAQNGGICAIYPGGAAKASFALPPSALPGFTGGKRVESLNSRQGLADSVILGPGRAAVVKASGGSTTLFVVAEPGKKFAVAAKEVLAGFGYGKVIPVSLPVQLLPMLPTGPALDPTAALRQVTG
jgi:type VII secretion protein EccB